MTKLIKSGAYAQDAYAPVADDAALPDGPVLVSLARKETNPELRRELVRRLSFMRSPAAVEYLTEILNK